MSKWKRAFSLAGLTIPLSLLSGCEYVVLDPKGPVAEIQKELIVYSVWFMAFIVLVVFILFAIIVYKYRERKDTMRYEPPEQEGSKFLETLWTIIPIVIVVALSIPTVKAIYALEKPPEQSANVKPLVIHATSVDWKWIFSYPEEDIETVNHITIPVNRPILFKLTSADSMASFWIPALGGQKYAMAGMQTELFLQADEVGTLLGRNANFTGEGFASQQFQVNAVAKEAFDEWIMNTKRTSPPLSQEQYDQLMLQGNEKEMTFSSTHLKWVDHSKDPEYALRAREKLGKLPPGTTDPVVDPEQGSSSHSGTH